MNFLLALQWLHFAANGLAAFRVGGLGIAASLSLIHVNAALQARSHSGAMLSTTDPIAHFGACLVPGGLDRSLVMQLSAASRMLSLHREEMARVDETCDQLVFLHQGATKLVAHASHDREQIVAFHFADDLVSVPAKTSHEYCLVALRATTLLTFSYDKVIELSAEHPAILRALLEASRTSLGRCREKSIALGRKSAPERVASFLVALSRRTAVEDGDKLLLPLPMSRRDIADSMGITIETVSRQLTILRERNVIESLGRSQIRILDLPALEGNAGFLSAAH